MRNSQIDISAVKLGNARMRCRNHGIMPCLHTGCAGRETYDPNVV
jgi:hypothetical protein